MTDREAFFPVQRFIAKLITFLKATLNISRRRSPGGGLEEDYVSSSELVHRHAFARGF